jgi:hypothetical protein
VHVIETPRRNFGLVLELGEQAQLRRINARGELGRDEGHFRPMKQPRRALRFSSSACTFQYMHLWQ